MRPKMFPQISIMVDPKGDVYGYHEATFLDKEGSERYCIGQINKNKSLIVITHYPKLLDYIKPDFIHILYNGKIIITDNILLAKKIEKNGYEWLINKTL